MARPPEPPIVIAAQTTQINPIASAMARSFADEPMMRYVVGNAHDAEERLTRLFASALRYAVSVGAVYVPQTALAGAAMCWQLPAPEPAPDVAATLEPPDVCLGVDGAARFNEVVEHVEGHLKQVVPPPVWYLPALGVDPAFQRRGYGTALMRKLMARAEADDIPVAWSTWSVPNVKFYERLGAEVVGEGDLPGPQMHYWLFRWVPAK